VALCLCKARLRPNGEVAAASPVSEVFSLLSAPPAYLEGDDEDLVRFFIAMRSGALPEGQRDRAQGQGRRHPAAEMLLAQDKLLWANSWSDMSNGLIYPLQAGPVRKANLVWRDEGRTARLGWQVEPAKGATHRRRPDRLHAADRSALVHRQPVLRRAGAEPRRGRHLAGRAAGAGGPGARRSPATTRNACRSCCWRTACSS
jgi:hypothetical protein